MELEYDLQQRYIVYCGQGGHLYGRPRTSQSISSNWKREFMNEWLIDQ